MSKFQALHQLAPFLSEEVGSEEVLAVGFSHENNEEDSQGQFYEPGRREFCGWWLTPYGGAGRG